MRVGRWLWTGLTVALVAGAVVIFTPLGHPLLQRMLPIGEVQPVDFSQIALDNQPARYLVCPGFDMCPELNDRTAIFDVSVSRLQEEWARVTGGDGLELILSDDLLMQYTYLKRSRFLQMPDLVTVQFIADEADEDRPRATLALYSRRVYVAGDFGANSSRVAGYLTALEASLGIYRR